MRRTFVSFESLAGTPRGGVSSIRRWRVSVAVLCMVAAAGCSRDKANLASRDSALDRDLTLATAAPAGQPLSVSGDTALGGTGVSSPPSPTPDPQGDKPPKAPGKMPATAPSTRPASKPNQPAPVPTRTPAPPSATAAVPAPPTTTAPIPSPDPAGASGGLTGSAAGPAPKSIPAGTALVAKTTAQLCSLANRPGDKLVANLNEELVMPDGARLPAGTPVLVEMAEAEPPADFAFRVRGVQVDGKLIPVSGTVASTSATTDHRVSKGGDKGKVATGAVVGAILGRVLGGGTRGTVIGAAGGAAAGTIMAGRNSTVEHCLPAGAMIIVTLANPLVLPSASQ